MNPYDVLGLATDADRDAIKRAYRLAAMTAHPDKQGGSREAMDRVQLAHDVLMDPERRDRFDRTGEIGAKRPDNSDAEAKQIIMSIAISIIDGVADSVLSRVDFVGSIRQSIKDRIWQIERDVVEVRAKAHAYSETAGRIRYEGAESFLVRMLHGHISELERKMERGRAVLKIHRLALTLLDGHSFDTGIGYSATNGSTIHTTLWSHFDSGGAGR